MNAVGAPQLISSKMTVVYKFVLPTLWISFFGITTIGLFSSAFHDSGGGPPPPELKWIFLLVWFLGTVMWYRFCIPLKKVLMNGSDLIISNYAREVCVPLRRVRRVAEGRFQNPRSITVFFDEDVGFGTSVLFMPPQKSVWPWQEHPIAKELRRLSASN